MRTPTWRTTTAPGTPNASTADPPTTIAGHRSRPVSSSAVTGVLHSHCSYCGTTYPDGVGWPRVCAACGQTAETSFRPDPSRPVYCDGCYRERREQRRAAVAAS